MAGATGTRPLGRSFVHAFTRAPRDLALLASTRMSARRRDARIGMSDSASAPPAMITAALPSAIWSCPAGPARLAEAQARFNEYAGISLGNCGRRLTSRPILGTSGDA